MFNLIIEWPCASSSVAGTTTSRIAYSMFDARFDEGISGTQSPTQVFQIPVHPSHRFVGILFLLQAVSIGVALYE